MSAAANAVPKLTFSADYFGTLGVQAGDQQFNTATVARIIARRRPLRSANIADTGIQAAKNSTATICINRNCSRV